MNLAGAFKVQELDNGYELVDGVAMHAVNGERFQIPHPVLKKHVRAGHFVELRIDSPRFSVHPDAPERCTCPLCDEETSKPILSHENPATLLPLPPQDVPSRGWGEEFWAQVVERDGCYFRALVDNPLHEEPLHGLKLGDPIVFRDDHILAVHGVHRQQIVEDMDADDLEELARWVSSLK